jgi:hypothetical protein
LRRNSRARGRLECESALFRFDSVTSKPLLFLFHYRWQVPNARTRNPQDQAVNRKNHTETPLRRGERSVCFKHVARRQRIFGFRWILSPGPPAKLRRSCCDATGKSVCMFRRSNVRAALRQPGRAGACKLPGPRIAAAAVAAEAGPGVLALAGRRLLWPADVTELSASDWRSAVHGLEIRFPSPVSSAQAAVSGRSIVNSCIR